MTAVYDAEFLTAAILGYQTLAVEIQTKMAALRRRLADTLKPPVQRPRKKRRRSVSRRRFWSEAELERVRELYPTTPTQAIAEQLGRTTLSVYQAADKLGLKKTEEFRKTVGFQKGSGVGKAFRFPKGHVPANKGVRRPGWHCGRMRETQFKKGRLNGQASRNWKPIGTIHADPEGFLRIKIRERDPAKHESGWHPEVWPLLHHRVWQQHHGPIPAGHAVVFRDGNRQNCAIENLECVPRAVLAERNRMWNRYPREMAEAIQLAGVLKRKLREASRGEK